MGIVVYLSDYMKPKAVPDFSSLWDPVSTLACKLQALTKKMYEEQTKYPYGVPADIVKYNEQAMMEIVKHHDHELDNGYDSVCDFITDLLCWEMEEATTPCTPRFIVVK